MVEDPLEAADARRADVELHAAVEARRQAEVRHDIDFEGGAARASQPHCVCSPVVLCANCNYCNDNNNNYYDCACIIQRQQIITSPFRW